MYLATRILKNQFFNTKHFFTKYAGRNWVTYFLAMVSLYVFSKTRLTLQRRYLQFYTEKKLQLQHHELQFRVKLIKIATSKKLEVPKT